MKRIIFTALCLVAAVSVGCKEKKTVDPDAYMVGEYKVYMLTESDGPGDIRILIDAPAEVLEKYVPDGTFPIATHAMMIERNGEVWLVDTGYGRNIFERMAAKGVMPEDVDHVLLTHMHGDHTGGMMRDGKPVFPNADVTVSEKEHAYWGSEEEMMKFPENRRGNFASAQDIFREYGEKLKITAPYDPGKELGNGIHMLAAYGHTPGHVMFLIKDGKEQLLIWGDLTHALAVQMPHPEISVTYDVDPDTARESRLQVLKYVIGNNIPVAGMHIPSPGMGTVKEDPSTGGYSFAFMSK